MAIPFLNNITLNNNEIQNVRLHNTGTSNNAAGQIFFNTGVNLAQYYIDGTDGWVSLKEYTFGDGDYINANITGTVAKPIITPDLSATAVTGNIDATKYLRGDNKWAAVTSIYGWTLQGNTGGPTDIVNTTAVSILGGQDLETTLAGTTLTIDLKVGPGAAGTSDNYVFNQSAAVADADDSIPFNSYTPGGSPPSTQVNVVKKTTLGTIPVTALTLVKTYIDESVTGLLQFIGGFDADTGDLDSPLTTDLYTNTVLAVGDLYVVSTAGDFFNNPLTPLTPGDSVIVQTAVTNPGTTPAVETDFIVVQSDTDLATDLTVGIGNVKAATAAPLEGLSVTYTSGTATAGLDISGLTTQAPANNALAFIPFYDQIAGSNLKIGLSTLSGDLNEFTSKAYTISDTDTIIHSYNTRDVIVQLYDTVTHETVYADVDRISTTQVTITFAATPDNDIRVLVQKIG